MTELLTKHRDEKGHALGSSARSAMRVMLSCGETSGDLYAGALVRSLLARQSELEVFGLGGPCFRDAGGTLVADFRGLAVTGLVEALQVLPQSWAVYRRLLDAARARRPDVLVLIDFPDFNFRLMAAVHRLGIPIIYYVTPQLWAWRPARLQTMRALVDRVLPIFPFEGEMYAREGMDVHPVGHPLVDLAVATVAREPFLRSIDLDPTRRTVALLPGSRPNELHRLVPVLAAATPRIASEVPQLQFVIARAPGLSDALFVPFGGMGVPIRTIEGQTDNVLAASDVVITASGTATVQAALHGRPMVVVYRLSPVTYRLGKPLVRVSMYSMVNLVAGSRVVPELIQEACTPENVAREAISLLTDGSRAERMRDELAAVRERLGAPGASDRAAAAIVDFIQARR